MTFDLQDTHQEYTDHGSSYRGEDEQIAGLRLDLLIEESDSIAMPWLQFGSPEVSIENRLLTTTNIIRGGTTQWA